MQLTPGSRLGTYEVLGALGAGGMGAIYRARDVQLGREVAIKVLSEEAARNMGGVRRLVAEAKAASALNHPNILTVYGMGEEDGSPYLVTELIDGVTLRALVADGPLPHDRALDIAGQALEGLSKAHAIGIVHRDLKPENLMVTRDGLVKILDFGLAKLTHEDASEGAERPLETLGLTATASGIVMGTAAYMSPEQARGQRADARSDLFSMGVILYEMLSGTNPFRRPTMADTVSAILRDEPPSLVDSDAEVPEPLAGLVMRALQKDPQRRFASAREMQTELVAAHGSGSLPPARPRLPGALTGGTQPVARAGRGKNATTVGVVAWAVVVVTVFALVSRQRHEPASPLPVAGGPPVVAVMAFENKTSDLELAKADVGRVLSDAFVQILYDTQGVQVVSPMRLGSILDGLGREYMDTSHDPKLVRKVCVRAGASMVLAGTLSQIGQTYTLNTTLTELGSGKLLGSFQSQAQGKDQLLASLTTSVSSTVMKTVGSAAGVTLAGGRDVGQIVTTSMDAYSHYVKGAQLNNGGEWAAALDELNQAVAIDPTMGVAWSMLACAYSFVEKQDLAQAALARALELKPRMSRKEQLWLQADAKWLAGNGEVFRTEEAKFVHEFPDDRDGYFYIGLGWQWLDEKCPEAIGWYDKAYALTPEYYPITKGMVDCYLKMGQRDRAVACLKRYLKLVRTGIGKEQAQGRLERLQRGLDT